MLVPFPGAGGSNYAEMFRWMNGTEGTPPFANGVNPDPELRADLGHAAGQLAGFHPRVADHRQQHGRAGLGPAGAGPRPDRHPRQLPPVQRHPADRRHGVLRRRSAGGGHRASPDLHQRRHLGHGRHALRDRRQSPAGTSNVKVYVIGFGVGASVQADLNAIAAAGGTGQAYFPANRAELTAVAGRHRGPLAARAPLRLRRHLRRRGRRLPRQGHDLLGGRRPLQARGRVRLQRRRRRHGLLLHRRGHLPGHAAHARARR